MFLPVKWGSSLSRGAILLLPDCREGLVKGASSIEEFTELLASGFEYVSDYEGGRCLGRGSDGH
jgi:hypothetical protein